MIGTLDVKINAAHPNLPLTPFYTFVSSPSSVRVTNVPKKIGSWEITKVFVTANYPDNTSRSSECVNVAGCYVATLPSCNVVGESANGFQITANGVDENGNAVTGYVLGHGDLIVLTRAGNITVGTTTWYFNFKDTQPTAPVKGDACIINGSLKWYNGTAWVDFGGFNLSDITLDLNADQATINEKLGEVIRRAGGTVIGCLVAILALSGMAAHEYPTNPDPSHKEFFGKMARDSLVLTNAPDIVESDPVFEAWKGTNTYVKTEADPTVHSWAKAATKPTYSVGEISGAMDEISKSTNNLSSVAHSGEYEDLKGKPTIPDVAHYREKTDMAVYETSLSAWSYTPMPAYDHNKLAWLNRSRGPGWYLNGPRETFVSGDANATNLSYNSTGEGVIVATRTTSIAPVPGVNLATSADFSTNNTALVETATSVVRSANGGVWDSALGVWWTPVMSNGKLTYQATTNVNLNAGN